MHWKKTGHPRTLVDPRTCNGRAADGNPGIYCANRVKSLEDIRDRAARFNLLVDAPLFGRLVGALGFAEHGAMEPPLLVCLCIIKGITSGFDFVNRFVFGRLYFSIQGRVFSRKLVSFRSGSYWSRLRQAPSSNAASVSWVRGTREEKGSQTCMTETLEWSGFRRRQDPGHPETAPACSPGRTRNDAARSPGHNPRVEVSTPGFAMKDPAKRNCSSFRRCTCLSPRAGSSSSAGPVYGLVLGNPMKQGSSLHCWSQTKHHLPGIHMWGQSHSRPCSKSPAYCRQFPTGSMNGNPLRMALT